MKRAPVRGAVKARRAHADHAARWRWNVHLGFACAVPAHTKPALAREDGDCHKINETFAVQMRRNRERTGRVALHQQVVEHRGAPPRRSPKARVNLGEKRFERAYECRKRRGADARMAGRKTLANAAFGGAHVLRLQRVIERPGRLGQLDSHRLGEQRHSHGARLSQRRHEARRIQVFLE